jgi:hypothetical protein
MSRYGSLVGRSKLFLLFHVCLEKVKNILIESLILNFMFKKSNVSAIQNAALSQFSVERYIF